VHEVNQIKLMILCKSTILPIATHSHYASKIIIIVIIVIITIVDLGRDEELEGRLDIPNAK